MIGIVLMILPAVMGVLGYYFLLSPVPTIIKVLGLTLMFFGGLVGTIFLLFIRFITPSAFALLAAKLKKRDLLLIYQENRKYLAIPAKFESGWVWLRDRLGFIVSSADDVGFLDGVPTYICYRGVGKTLNPKAMVDLAILEDILGEDAANELRKRLRESGYYEVIEKLGEAEAERAEVVA